MAGKIPKLQSKDEKHSIHTHKDDDPSVSRMVGLEVKLHRYAPDSRISYLMKYTGDSPTQHYLKKESRISSMGIGMMKTLV